MKSSIWRTAFGLVALVFGAVLPAAAQTGKVFGTVSDAITGETLIQAAVVIGATGYMMTTNAYWGVEWVEDAHETLVGWAEVSVDLHIAAVIWESMRTGVNLPQAMVSGGKSVPDDAIIVK